MKKKGWRSWVGPVLVAIIVAGLVVAVGWLVSDPGKPTTANTTYTVRRGSISAVVRTTGRLELVRQTRLSFKVGDTVRRITVKPGDFVPAGTLLAELDSTNLERQLAQAQAQREIARFNQSAQAERSQTNPNATPASVSELYSQARQAELADQQLAQARQALDNARLYAPYDGTVLTVEVVEGDNVGPGQLIVTFGDLSRLQVRADVDEIDVANVAAGQPVQFTLDAFPGRNFEGRVGLVSPTAGQRQGSTTYPTIVSFTKPAGLILRAGMAANLTVTSLSRSNVLLVPNRALETIGLRKYATRLLAGGQLEKTPVETGLSNPDATEVIAGLEEGDRISLPR